MRGSVRNHDSMKSFATGSSNAIPIGIPDYYLEQRDSVPSMPDTMPRPDSEYDDSSVDLGGDGRDSRWDDRDLDPSPEPGMVVRQASVGKKSKPTLTTVKSGERMRKDSAGAVGLSSLPSQQRGMTAPREPPPAMIRDAALAKDLGLPSESDPESFSSARQDRYGDSDKDIEAAVAGAAIPAALHLKKDQRKGREPPPIPANDPLSSGTGLLDPSSSESEKSLKTKSSKELLGANLSKPQPTRSRGRSPLAQEVDPRVETIMGGLAKGGALSPTSQNSKLKTPTAGLSERAGKRRPPRLNVDAVKDAEARGSLTSLPDLIQRATRLASNLDRGKTASRLGMNWLDGAEANEKHRSGLSENRRSGSISDILASFPPPGLATPPGSSRGELRRSLTNWSSNLRHSTLPSDSDGDGVQQKPSRRCCGMPLWLFLLLLVVLILLIAAAIIVPVVLIVIPRQNAAGSPTAAGTSCSNKLACENGGTNVASNDGSCKCLCVNGYTGTTCTTNSGAGCTTTSVGSTSDATVGNAIPRLLSGASTNFSVPLDGQSLLGLFNGADLNCASENALVTFNNNAERSLQEEPLDLRPTPTLEKRQTATSNGIVFDTATPTSASSSSPSSSTSSSAPHSTSTSTSSASSGANSTTSIDFARVAVLYILQTSGQLNSATQAQSNLQSYFTSDQTATGQDINAANVSLGNGFTCDLDGHSISLGNGTVVGGASAS